MAGTRDQVHAGLSRLASELALGLDGSGWAPKVGNPHRLASFVRQVGHSEYFATVEIMRGGRVRLREKWPVELFVRYGCGHRPTFELMPRMGLDLELALVDEPTVHRFVPDVPEIQIVNAADVDRMVEWLSLELSNHRDVFASELADDAAMERALRDPLLTPKDWQSELLPVFLAALGRTGEAAELAEAYLQSEGVEDQDEYAEFVRRIKDLASDVPPTTSRS